MKESAQAIQPATTEPPLVIMLRNAMPRIEEVMAANLTPKRLFQLACSTINKNPKLAECTPASFLSCVMKCATLGLEPSAVDGMGRAYILPYGQEATFILGYKGMLELVRRSGQVKSISARAVYEGDKFEYEFGLNEKCSHIPGDGERIKDNLTHVYMLCEFKDGGHHLEVMKTSEIEAIRKRSKAGNSGPWATDYEAMAKKTVIRRAFPYLPVSIEAQAAVAADETDGGFTQEFNKVQPMIPEVEYTDDDGEVVAPNTYNAKCKSCGNVVEKVHDTADVLELDIPCCETPSYEVI